MNIILINGSPRKNKNTATLLAEAAKGAESKGATTEIINLYDLNYKGCISCFACRLKGGKSYGKCAVMDELTPILEKIHTADAIILGSPIYFGDMTGEMRSFIERMAYPYIAYDKKLSSLYPKKIDVGVIYTMNVNKLILKILGFKKTFKITESFLKKIFGNCESLLVTDTYQFDDYSKYESSVFNVEAKAKRKAKQFPKDCNKAFNLGAKFASKIKKTD